ncbi:MAG TPA: hypothetical protein VGB56_14410 [Flavisolibacter sp.]|jgi:hypothetical protein
MKGSVETSNKYLSLLLPADVAQLQELNRKLAVIQCSEATLIQIELVFFDLLNILRANSQHEVINDLLGQLKSVHEHKYKDAQAKHLTPRNLLLNIKRFKNAVRSVLLQVLFG